MSTQVLSSIILICALIVNAKIQKIESVLREFEFQPSTSGFLIKGFFEQQNNSDFLVCFDYSFDPNQFIMPSSYKPYPIEECGGSALNAQNPYWFAIRGHWFPNQSLSVDFVNTLDGKFELLALSGDTILNRRFEWKLAIEPQENSPNTVYFNGLGSVEIPSIDASSYVHIRLPQNGKVVLESVSTQLNPVILDQLPKYHLLSEILKGDDTIISI